MSPGKAVFKACFPKDTLELLKVLLAKGHGVEQLVAAAKKGMESDD